MAAAKDEGISFGTFKNPNTNNIPPSSKLSFLSIGDI
jgi:hypothetical protein